MAIISKTTARSKKKTKSISKVVKPQHDVIIIGAGVSGLTTAYRLTNAGKKVLVLEARERLGGRTKTVKVGKGNFDVGAQWIGPLQKRITTLVAELGIETFPTYDSGKKILDLFGKLSYYSGLIPIVAPHNLIIAQLAIWRIDAMARKVPLDAPWNAKHAKKWDATIGINPE